MECFKCKKESDLFWCLECRKGTGNSYMDDEGEICPTDKRRWATDIPVDELSRLGLL